MRNNPDVQAAGEPFHNKVDTGNTVIQREFYLELLTKASQAK
jgi:hypothetical protein